MKRISDKQQAALGKTIQFGFAQIANPTPLYIKYIFRAVAFFSGLWAVLPADLLGIPPETLAAINKWLIVGNTLMLFAIKFFGWDYQDK